MEIWIILFLIVLLVSFLLALKSMSDYRDRPNNFGQPYSLYLIQNPQALTEPVMDQLYQASLKDGLILSLERLYKGSQTVLVVYGPIVIMKPFYNPLGLLELEEYSHKVDLDKEEVLAWEMGLKGLSEVTPPKPKSKVELLDLENHEQCWWQITFRPVVASKDSGFESVIRAVVVTGTKTRALEAQQELLKIGAGLGLALIPQAFSKTQLLDFYKSRSLPTNLVNIQRGETSLLNSKQLLGILNI